jgi:hypothetical protein
MLRPTNSAGWTIEESVVRFTCLACVAGLVSLLSASPACAQKQNESGQTPPQASGPSDGCVSHDASFKEQGGKPVFVIALQNVCEKRMRCVVNAYLTTSHGPTKIRAKMTLAPQSRGKAASKSHVTPLRGNGGMANVSHSCKRA